MDLAVCQLHEQFFGGIKRMRKRILTAAFLTVMMTSLCFADYERETIRQVQQALNEAGFDCGKADGIAGKATAGAVLKYQQAKGLTADGNINDELIESLGLAENENMTEPEEDSTYIEFDENAFDGKWVSFSEAFEIYVPADMEVEDAAALAGSDDAQFDGIDGMDSRACLRCAEPREDGISVSVDEMRVSDPSALQNIGVSSAQELYEMFMSVYLSEPDPVRINGITGVPLTFVYGEDFSFIWLEDDTIFFLTIEHHHNDANVEPARNILASLRRLEDAGESAAEDTTEAGESAAEDMTEAIETAAEDTTEAGETAAEDTTEADKTAEESMSETDKTGVR